MRSYTACGACSAPPNSVPQCGQLSARASTTLFGCGCSLRPVPARPWRLRRPPRTGLFAFSPREGGSDEFAGVLGGAPRRASNSATWALSSALVAVSLATFAGQLRDRCGQLRNPRSQLNDKGALPGVERRTEIRIRLAHTPSITCFYSFVSDF